MKVAVVGLGSMGKRRIRLIQKLIEENKLQGWSIVGVDLDESRREEAQSEFGILVLDDLNQALDACDAVIVSTSPLSHASIVNSALEAGKHVFTEINLVPNGYEDAIALADRFDKTLFLSSTFLYRDEISYIANRVSESKPGMYRYHVGQYLPDWHPWEDYRSFFVANKETNACREILAIELPWLQRVFGRITNISSIHAKMSALDLPYDDFYSLTIEHENGTIGSVQVDVVCRKAVRNFEFSSEDAYLVWDGSATGLKDLDIGTGALLDIDLYDGSADHQDDYASFVVENAYQNELSSFFDAVEGKFRPLYGYEEDLVTLTLIDDIERR